MAPERTLTEIQGWEDLTPDGKNDRGLEIFAQLPAPTPGERTDHTPGAAPNPAAPAVLPSNHALSPSPPIG